MKIEHLTNRLATFDNELQAQLAICRSATIATAFISAETIALLAHAIKSNKGLTDCRLLIGVYGGFVQKSDLESLLALAQHFAGRISIQISRNPAFHWKYYALDYPQKIGFYTGSANFTESGLATNAEFMLKVSLSKRVPAEAKIAGGLAASFEVEWWGSAAISEFPLADYPAAKVRSGVKWPTALRDFFERRESSQAVAIPAGDKVFVTYLTDNLSASTRKAVYSYNPSWTRRDIEFFVCANVSDFRKCKGAGRVLIIERLSRGHFETRWVEATDYCDSIKTADGKYFAAYRAMSGWKKIDAALEEALKAEFEIDLRARIEPFCTKVLRKRQAERMEELIKPAKQKTPKP